MSADRLLGMVALGFGLVALFVWIPADVETGLTETYRRQTTIGDAMLPSALAVLMAAIGAWLLLRPSHSEGVTITRSQWRFVAGLAVVLSLTLAIMFWSAPLAVLLTGAHESGYRPLRDTVPWKYIGFVIGGFAMLFFQLSWLGGGMTLRRAVLALAVVFVLVALIDLPFDDLLLPPNGDY